MTLSVIVSVKGYALSVKMTDYVDRMLKFGDFCHLNVD